MKVFSPAHPPRLSPLRYPGGKQLLAPYIAGVIEENYLSGCEFFEPFAGGAAVSLELVRLGYVDSALLIERDPLVYAFWWSVCNGMDDLLAEVQKVTISLETWKKIELQRGVKVPTTEKRKLLKLGLAGLFLNRTNFSGVLGAGPIGGMSQTSKYKIDCRFNKQVILATLETLRTITPRLRVKFGDALSWLSSSQGKLSTRSCFVYVDPPYYGQGKKLYRHSFTDTQHQRLASLLTPAKFPWLASYDDTSFIRNLYQGSVMQPIFMDHRVKSSRLAQEVAISNLEIPPPVYEGFSTAELSINFVSAELDPVEVQ